MGFINRMVKTILGVGSNVVNSEEGLSNEKILNELVRRFEQEVNFRSLKKRMIYPMTFTVIMHNDDYQNHKVDIQLFINEVVDSFYEIILKKKKKYPNYTNPARYWTFRFIPGLTEEMELDGKTIPVQKGRIFIMASILDVTETEKASSSINVSLPVGASTTLQKVNINLAAFEHFVGVDEPIHINWKAPEKAEGETSSCHSAKSDSIFNATKDVNIHGVDTKTFRSIELGNDISPFLKIQPFEKKTAMLAYKLSGELYTHKIESDECWVVGKDGNNDKGDTFVVKSSKVMNPHLLICKDKATGKYKVAAFASAKFENENEALPVSTIKNPKWTLLDQDMNIIMNGFVVRFIKNN